MGSEMSVEEWLKQKERPQQRLPPKNVCKGLREWALGYSKESLELVQNAMEVIGQNHKVRTALISQLRKQTDDPLPEELSQIILLSLANKLSESNLISAPFVLA